MFCATRGFLGGSLFKGAWRFDSRRLKRSGRGAPALFSLWASKHLNYYSISNAPYEHKEGTKWEQWTHQMDPPQGLMLAHVSWSVKASAAHCAQPSPIALLQFAMMLKRRESLVSKIHSFVHYWNSWKTPEGLKRIPFRNGSLDNTKVCPFHLKIVSITPINSMFY